MDVKPMKESTGTAQNSNDLFKYVGLVRPVHDILAKLASSSAYSLRMVFLQEVDMQSLSGCSSNPRSHCAPSADQEAPTQAAPRHAHIFHCVDYPLPADLHVVNTSLPRFLSTTTYGGVSYFGTLVLYCFTLSLSQ